MLIKVLKEKSEGDKVMEVKADDRNMDAPREEDGYIIFGEGWCMPI